jgi:butyryl-CoA dehydrogenase
VSVPVVDRRDLSFQLFEVLDAERLTERARFAGHDRATFEAALDTAEAVAREQFRPHYVKADREEPRVEDGRVRLPDEVAPAIRAFTDAGFMAAHRGQDEGGMQLPWVVTQACFACFQAANIGTAAYSFLSIANANLLDVYGTQQQKALYMRPQVAGRFLGTMCLSEPQAGSSLGDVRAEARPAGDGTYRLKGTKMWISGGEHEIAENIVHLVLARIKGAPAGVKGLSLFIAPRRRVEPDGSLGRPNDVTLIGLNHKMGYRGTTNTLLAFGEADDCVAELVGQPGQGLAIMFHMMNEARIGVGLGATMLGVAGYLHARDYARTRTQGRPADRRDPASPPIPIVEHADVRRLLMLQKAYVEGALALCLYAARLVDEQRTAEDPEKRRRAGLELDLITPVVKAWPSDWCLEANRHAIQVLGGYGYTRDFPVEQIYRDNRLNPIHEGTNGIQALDLVGRKLGSDGGEALNRLYFRMEGAADMTAEDPALVEPMARFADALRRAKGATSAVLDALEHGQAARALANASVHLDLFGHLLVGWRWLEQGRAAARALARAAAEGTKLGAEEAAFYRGKIAACRFFHAQETGRVHHWAPIVEAMDPSVLETDPVWL